jgi:type I restriction enzyme M protein
MAQRPIFITREHAPYYECRNVEFTYNAGFAVSQKQKNITAIHEAYRRQDPAKNILEISSKSLQPIGVALSAFNLLKYVPSLDKKIPVENVFQGGKVYALGGPFMDLYADTPKNAKRDERHKQSGRLIGFHYEGNSFPLSPTTAFYDWIYINALLENKDLAEEIVRFDAFTDVEFNPQKSLNCQAKAAAVFVSLFRTGKMDAVKNFDEFIKLYGRD